MTSIMTTSSYHIAHKYVMVRETGYVHYLRPCYDHTKLVIGIETIVFAPNRVTCQICMNTNLYEDMCIRYDAAFDKVDFARQERLALEQGLVYVATWNDLQTLKYIE